MTNHLSIFSCFQLFYPLESALITFIKHSIFFISIIPFLFFRLFYRIYLFFSSSSSYTVFPLQKPNKNTRYCYKHSRMENWHSKLKPEGIMKVFRRWKRYKGVERRGLLAGYKNRFKLTMLFILFSARVSVIILQKILPILRFKGESFNTNKVKNILQIGK